jgi:hypothetical protein
VRQFLGQIGLPPTLLRLEHMVVAPRQRPARQGAHDLEHLRSVFLVGDQFAKGAQGRQRLDPLGLQARVGVEVGGRGHGRSCDEAQAL